MNRASFIRDKTLCSTPTRPIARWRVEFTTTMLERSSPPFAIAWHRLPLLPRVQFGETKIGEVSAVRHPHSDTGPGVPSICSWRNHTASAIARHSATRAGPRSETARPGTRLARGLSLPATAAWARVRAIACAVLPAGRARFPLPLPPRGPTRCAVSVVVARSAPPALLLRRRCCLLRLLNRGLCMVFPLSCPADLGRSRRTVGSSVVRRAQAVLQGVSTACRASTRVCQGWYPRIARRVVHVAGARPLTLRPRPNAPQPVVDTEARVVRIRPSPSGSVSSLSANASSEHGRRDRR